MAYDLGVEGPQAVIAASGQLAGDRDRRDLAVVGVLDLGVVVVVGSDLAGGVLGRLEQRPAQDLGSLPGEITLEPLAIRLVHGDVQAGMAHRLL
jgi:hypothetical protein